MANLIKSPVIIGSVFEKLTILKDLGCDESTVRWVECQCLCGNIKRMRYGHLKSGASRSCGCFKMEQDKINLHKIKHGLANSSIYKVYLGIKRRCYNQNEVSYKDYGGRGIQMCKIWFDDFITFYEWCNQNGYKKGLFIDRIDVNGNYEPTNCRFVNATQSARNTRATVYLTFNNETRPMIEWAEITGIPVKRIWQRLRRDKWTVEKTLTYPARQLL